MGARAHMSPRMLQILPEHLEFGYVGRPERASPAEGSPERHAAEQARIVAAAFETGDGSRKTDVGSGRVEEAGNGRAGVPREAVAARRAS